MWFCFEWALYVRVREPRAGAARGERRTRFLGDNARPSRAIRRSPRLVEAPIRLQKSGVSPRQWAGSLNLVCLEGVVSRVPAGGAGAGLEEVHNAWR